MLLKEVQLVTSCYFDRRTHYSFHIDRAEHRGYRMELLDKAIRIETKTGEAAYIPLGSVIIYKPLEEAVSESKAVDTEGTTKPRGGRSPRANATLQRTTGEVV